MSALSSAAPQGLNEFDERGADFVRPLLLGPVTAAGKHLDLAQAGNESFQVCEQLVRAGEGHHKVAIARDIERRHCHLKAGHRAGDFPVAIDVAVVVERAAEAAAPKLLAVKVDVAFADPWWQDFGCAGSLQKAAALRHHADAR